MKIFQISAQYLWGWRCKLDPTQYSGKDEIVKDVVRRYREFLIEHNLLDLKDILDRSKNNFHIHDDNDGFPWYNSETIYICNHTEIN